MNCLRSPLCGEAIYRGLCEKHARDVQDAVRRKWTTWTLETAAGRVLPAERRQVPSIQLMEECSICKNVIPITREVRRWLNRGSNLICQDCSGK